MGAENLIRISLVELCRERLAPPTLGMGGATALLSVSARCCQLLIDHLLPGFGRDTSRGPDRPVSVPVPLARHVGSMVMVEMPCGVVRRAPARRSRRGSPAAR